MVSADRIKFGFLSQEVGDPAECIPLLQALTVKYHVTGMEDNRGVDFHNCVYDLLMDLGVRARIAVNYDTIPAIGRLGEGCCGNTQGDKYRRQT